MTEPGCTRPADPAGEVPSAATTESPWHAWVEACRRETGIPLELCAYSPDAPRPSGREPGDWWRQGDAWCLHLDDAMYVRLGADVPDSTQRLLSFAVRHMPVSGHPEWRERVRGWALELARLTPAALLRAWAEARPADAVNIRGPWPPFPGWIVWLQLGVPGAASAWNIASADVEEAIEGFLPGGLVVWLEEGRNRHSALLFWPATAAEEAEEDDKEPGSPHGESTEAKVPASLEAVRRSVRQLVQVLAADGLVAAHASIGCRIDGAESLYRGVVTAVMAHRQHDWLAAEGLVRDDVSAWADQPLLWIAAALPDNARRWFTAAAATRCDVDRVWNTEVWETLQGMIAADLNVSEAARRLYLHRNTLLNRIERIRSSTGYDIRRFRDAAELWWLWAMRRTRAPGGPGAATDMPDRSP
jgi:hypothetical protein